MKQYLWNNNRFLAWHPNKWDILMLLIILGVIFFLAWGAGQMNTPYQIGQQITISLSIKSLIIYSCRSIVRVFLAMFCSCIFALIFGTLAAKNKHIARILIPTVDILQSIPILGFLSLTISMFISLFKGSFLGPEMAAIFVIITSQVWNMLLDVYQSIRMIPKNLIEVSEILRLSAWQRFWRLELPFATPSFIWNIMLSMSASWFFVVACEAITVNKQTIFLPGIGSYIYIAIQNSNKIAIYFAVISMFIIIFLYDQLLFRPLLYWSQKFQIDNNIEQDQKKLIPWLVLLLQKTRLFHYFGVLFYILFQFVINAKIFNNKKYKTYSKSFNNSNIQVAAIGFWYIFISIICVVFFLFLVQFIFKQLNFNEAIHVIILGSFTFLRIFILLILSSIIWIPIGVAIGLNPFLLKWGQPIVQILAAFPANI